MATSGLSNFNLDLTEIVEEAFERAGGELRTGYDLRTASRSLNLMFPSGPTSGLNMFTYEQGSIPLVAGTATYNLPADTVDLLEHVIRTGAGKCVNSSRPDHHPDQRLDLRHNPQQADSSSPNSSLDRALGYPKNYCVASARRHTALHLCVLASAPHPETRARCEHHGHAIPLL
jgi:hypothetical protein